MQKHISVLQNETIKYLDPKTGENFIDATMGYAGHAKLILGKTGPSGKLLGIEQDEEALRDAKNNLKKYGERVQYEHVNFTELGLLIRKWPVDKVDGILIDLGVSTPQLTGERGFSFRGDAILDMRMNPSGQALTAAGILKKYSEQEIAKILFDGEERFSRQIARKIVQVRAEEPILTTQQLVEVVRSATPPSYRFNRQTHFATNTFRALRMAVNNELENLKKVLPQAVKVLSSGGRLGIISFHSLEDRIVKQYLRDNPELEVLTSKPITPTEQEVELNPASRSAKLRVAKKI